MLSREERRRTLDEVAELYDRHRPGYPEPLVDDVLVLSGIPPHGHILEVGSGTGQATMSFARRGYHLTCLEPGPRLAEIAEHKLAGLHRVRVHVCTFEDWPLPSVAFDLLIAATSFHLVDPSSGLAKAASALRPDGALAIFSNRPQPGDADVHRGVQEAYARHAPELNPGNWEVPLEDQIDATGAFGTVWMARYPWRKTYAAADYVGLMETQSPHRLLPPERRSALLRAIGAAITDHGGSITIDYVARLHLARRRPAP